MKRCPKCNRTYQTDTQKFCTHDGGLLFAIDPGLSETVQFDSAKIQDAVAKPTTRDLENQKPAGFDPEATVVSEPIDLNEATREVRARNTGELVPPQTTPHQMTPPAASTSGPIPPPPAPSGPIATSAPLPAQPIAPARPSQPLPPARKKKSKLPLVLGILAVLFVLGVGGLAVAYFFVLKPMLDEKRMTRNTNSEPIRTTPTPGTSTSPSDVTQPSNEPPVYAPPPGAVQFVNAKDNLDGKLLEHYVDFSFYYPNTWQKDPTAGVPGASNFAKVERLIPPDFTQENFAVGWYSSSGSAETDRSLFPNLAENLSAQLSSGFPEYRKVSEGPTRAGVYDGYEFRFEAMSRNTAKGDIKIWGRVIFVPQTDGSKTGATLLMLATSLAPELESIDDIGSKGELPMLLESFRFGKK
jgi:hypothetical protein